MAFLPLLSQDGLHLRDNRRYTSPALSFARESGWCGDQGTTSQNGQPRIAGRCQTVRPDGDALKEKYIIVYTE